MTGRTGSHAHSVVLVDDSADIRRLMRLQLEATGHFAVVGEAGDGATAIRVAAEHHPDLVLLDISMPVMDGLEALPEIRRECPDAVIMMFTGFASDELRDKARSLGATDVASKGHDIREIAQRALAILDQSQNVDMPQTTEEDQRTFAVHLERFREFFEGASIGLCTLTLTGRIARTNSCGRELLDDPEPVGRYLTEFVAPQDAPAVDAAIKAATSGDGPGELEHRMRDERRIVTSAIHAVLDEKGEPLYLLLQLQDVTKLRRTENALAHSEARFRLFVDSVEDYAIYMLDPDGHVVSWNAGAEPMKGYSDTEIVGKHFSLFFTPEARAAGHPEAELAAAKREGRYREQGWRVRKDGSRFFADVTLTALFERGRLVGYGKVTRAVRDGEYEEPASATG